MKNIFDLVTPQNVKTYFENSAQKSYLGSTLFPATKQLGLTLSYLKGRNGTPVVLKAAAFDANAPVRKRIGVSQIQTEMPFFREQMSVKETERQQINTFLSGGLTAQAELVVKNVYDDAKNLIEGANVVPERMIMQVLSTGRIDIDSGAEGAQYEYDYNLDPQQIRNLTGTDAWDDPSSLPLDDIMDAQDFGRTFGGVNLTRAICNSTTFKQLVRNTSVRFAIDPTGKETITPNRVKDYFRDTLNLEIAVYDEQYVNEEGVTESFFPDNVFTLIPTGTLGETVYGTTPEESDLLSGATDAAVEIIGQGIAITTQKTYGAPVNVQTVASEIVLPSFPNANQIVIINVA